eukprot:1496645-Pyramimonas_sp.AAC.1
MYLTPSTVQSTRGRHGRAMRRSSSIALRLPALASSLSPAISIPPSPVAAPAALPALSSRDLMAAVLRISALPLPHAVCPRWLS